MPSVNTAVSTIASKLAAEALRDGVSPQELKQFVADGTKGLSKDEIKQVLDSFQAQLPRFGDSYFKSVFGVSKDALLGELSTQARGGGGSAVGGFIDAHKAHERQATLREVARFLMSPLPGEDSSALTAILKRDSALAKHGNDKLNQLTTRLSALGAPPADALIAAFDKTGAVGPSASTLSTIKQKLMEESLRPDLDVAEAVKGDKWLSTMLAETGKAPQDIAQYLLFPSRHELKTLVDAFFDIPGNQRKAENAVSVLNDIKAQTGGREVLLVRDLPASVDRLTHEDAEYILQYRVNDVRLEENHGRFTVAARYYGDAVSDEQVVKAMEILVGDYGSELRANNGDWRGRGFGEQEPIPEPVVTRPDTSGGDRRARFHDGIKLLNEKKSGDPVLKDILDFKFTTAEMAPCVRVRTNFPEQNAAFDAARPKIEEAVAQMLEKNGFADLVSRNYLGNTIIVTDVSGSHGV